MIKSIHSFRFLFIMFVVFSHIFGKGFDFGGECGVSFFFILSGFVLSYAYGQKVTDGTFRTMPFIRKQLVRFYPLHLLTFLVVVLLDAHAGQYFEWYRLLPNALLLQSWIPDDRFFFVANGPSWFLCDLFFFYLVFAAAFRVLMQISVRVLGMLMLAVMMFYFTVAWVIPLDKVNAILYISPVMRLIDFCIGILCFRVYASQRGQWFGQWLQTLSPVTVTLMETALIVVVVWSFFVYEDMTLRLRCAALFWCYLPLFILVFVMTDKLKGGVTALLHLRFMQWLGGISFELYLTHCIVLRFLESSMFISVFGDQAPATLPFILVTLFFTVVVAWFTKRFFVKPIVGLLT